MIAKARSISDELLGLIYAPVATFVITLWPRYTLDFFGAKISTALGGCGLLWTRYL